MRPSQDEHMICRTIARVAAASAAIAAIATAGLVACEGEALDDMTQQPAQQSTYEPHSGASDVVVGASWGGGVDEPPVDHPGGCYSWWGPRSPMPRMQGDGAMTWYDEAWQDGTTWAGMADGSPDGGYRTGGNIVPDRDETETVAA